MDLHFFAKEKIMYTERLNNKLASISVITAACALITVLLSYDFWLSERLYALTPVYSAFELPEFLSRLILFLFLASLVVTLFFPFRINVILSFCLLLILILLDQSRLQPYIFMYVSTFFVLSMCGNKHNSAALNSLRIMVAFAYFWSGIQKINYEFFTGIFPWFISPYMFVSSYPEDIPYNTILENTVVALIYAVPFFEASIGILLIVMKNKTAPLIMAAVMLAIVMLSLGPLGLQHNFIVWPWNIWLFAMAVWLFQDHVPVKQLFRISRAQPAAAKLFVILLFGIMPLFSFWNMWDAYLSFKLYSGDKYIASASIENADKEKLPAALKPHLKRGDMIPYLDVTLKHYNMVPYPEKRVYLNVWRHWCDEYGFEDSQLFITSVKGRFGKREHLEKYNCKGEAL